MLTINMCQLPPFKGWFGFVMHQGKVLVFRRHLHFCEAWKRARAEQVNTSTALGL